MKEIFIVGNINEVTFIGLDYSSGGYPWETSHIQDAEQFMEIEKARTFMVEMETKFSSYIKGPLSIYRIRVEKVE